MTAITDAATALAARKTQSMSPQEIAFQNGIWRFSAVRLRLETCLRETISQELPPNFHTEYLNSVSGHSIDMSIVCTKLEIDKSVKVTLQRDSSVVYSSSIGRQSFDLNYIEGTGVAERHLRETFLAVMNT